jgi:hypothetical protein
MAMAVLSQPVRGRACSCAIITPASRNLVIAPCRMVAATACIVENFRPHDLAQAGLDD